MSLLGVRCRSVSGGMKKKLALACALIHRPDLIVLDEPTTGVDPVSRRDFWVILGELLHEGLTIVVATPYLDEAERCSRVGLLDRGRFLTIGPPGEIKRGIRGRLFEAVTPAAREAQRAFSAGSFPGLLELQTQGNRLHLRIEASHEQGNGNASPEERLRSFFSTEGLPLENVREISPTLENLFISLIREEQQR